MDKVINRFIKQMFW